MDLDKVQRELERKVRFENHQKAITRLLNKPVFSPEWEEELWLEIQGAQAISPSKMTGI